MACRGAAFVEGAAALVLLPSGALSGTGHAGLGSQGRGRAARCCARRATVDGGVFRAGVFRATLFGDGAAPASSACDELGCCLWAHVLSILTRSTFA